MTNKIIELIKSKNIKELLSIIKKNPDIDLNAKDDNYNHFIYYVILFNEETLLDVVLERNIRLDILDTDGRNILYIPIKFGYNSMLKKILLKDKNNIGLPIIDIKDKLGLTALHYSIIFNNFDAFKILLDNESNIYMNNNQHLNAFHICIQYNRIDFFIELLSKIPELVIFTSNNESLLQYALSFERYNFIPLILKKKININNQETVNGLTALHHSIIKNKIDIIQALVNFGANINLQDSYGNTPLHYAVSEDNTEITKLLIKHNPNCNLTNIDGNTPLHTYLSNSYSDKEILNELIKKTDLNIQNNQGLTCLRTMVDMYIIENYHGILKDKELNFFIQDNTGKDLSQSLNDEHVLNLAIESFYNMIKKNSDHLEVDWEIWCGRELVDKLKTLTQKKSEPEHICKDKIKEVILKERRSIPRLSKFDLVFDSGIFVNTCYYTGVPLDILFGSVFLHSQFSKDGLGLILDYPLTVNKPLENYYQKLGIDYPFKLEFSNCEILWSFQKIFYPSYFEHELLKALRDTSIKYISIPLGIELTNGSHANILFIDKKNKTIERFEPNGSSQPFGLNYNPDLLNDILRNKFSEYDLIYVSPDKFLPSIGFQILENIEESRYRRVGDPNGFCGLWCVWWVYHRIKNHKLSNIELVHLLIKNIKLENRSFKNIIRNFSHYITEIRDKVLKKFNVDINDWMVNSITPEIISQIEKEIFKMVK